MIPFNKPVIIGHEFQYIKEAVYSGKISGDGIFTKKCEAFFEQYGFNKVLLTTSCTDALEMAAILLDIQPGDEIIIPSYTFVSTANAFALRGAEIRFVDCEDNTPNLDADKVEELITPKTKALVVVHYAGIACEIEKLVGIARKHDLYLIEDAAQAIDSYYEDKPLGSFGNLATFSFHETKNVISGEGGMIVINDNKFVKRAEIIREKGTNRTAFFRGEIDKYQWVDIGSSFLPSDIIAAFLFAQLEKLKNIQARRKEIWERYYSGLYQLTSEYNIQLPHIPVGATNNGHIFYLVCNDLSERDQLIASLKENNIMAVFHYQSLHKSKYFKNRHDGRQLPNCDRFSDCLVRLPLFYSLSGSDQDKIIDHVQTFYKNR